VFLDLIIVKTVIHLCFFVY